MHKNEGITTIDKAISKCLDEGTPESLQELSERIYEQQHLLENKYSLYKMMINHLVVGKPTDSQHSQCRETSRKLRPVGSGLGEQ